jgi:hypothetical protein
MRKISCVLFIFLLINNLSNFIKAQSRDKKYYEFMHNAKTPDLLYLNDSITYLMNKSPLEIFSGYKNLYDSYQEIVMVELKMEFGTEIHPFDNASYQVIWCLRDSILYLSDIKFYSINIHDYKSIFPNNEQYKLMEKLTKVDFDTTKPPLSSDPFRHRNTIGMMAARWLNDTLLIKKSRESFEDIDKWIETPCEELIFKNGKLISMETKDIY